MKGELKLPKVIMKVNQARQKLNREFMDIYGDLPMLNDIAFHVDEQTGEHYIWKFETADGETHVWKYNFETGVIEKEVM